MALIVENVGIKLILPVKI